MAGEEFKVQFNPFAYQTTPLKQVGFTGAQQPAAEPKPQENKFGFATRPQKQSYDAGNAPVDKNFIKNTIAYVPFATSPVSDTNYDDSDYRGRGAYFIA